MASINPRHPAEEKLLGGLSFVSRTFEGRFEDSPYVLDMDANLYIGPADRYSRDEHAVIEVVYHFLHQTGRIDGAVRDLLCNRSALLDAFSAFDEARTENDVEEFRIVLYNTYDGTPLPPAGDDDMPAGPCGQSVNEIKRRFYARSRKLDPKFDERKLSKAQSTQEALFSE